MTLEHDRRALLEGIRNQFAVELLWYENFKFSCYRDDVSVHGFFSAPDSEPTEERKQEIRGWVESRGWQFSRQMKKDEVIPDRLTEYIFLAPMIFVELERGYHATRLVSVSSIQATGLLPSTAERQTTTDRGDCEGNIYICEALGTPTDAGVQGSRTAHWWHHHLAQKNRFNDPDWVILEIEIGNVHRARLYKDIWSESGIVVGAVDAIPPGVIRVVYQPDKLGSTTWRTGRSDAYHLK
jgi:hypothetical protein